MPQLVFKPGVPRAVRTFLEESYAIGGLLPSLRGVIERLASSNLGESVWRKLPTDDAARARLFVEWAICYAIPDVLIKLLMRPVPHDYKVLCKILDRHGEPPTDVLSILGSTRDAARGVREATMLVMNPNVFPDIIAHWKELWGDGDPSMTPEKLLDLLPQLAGFFENLAAEYHAPIETVPPILSQGAERAKERIYTIAMVKKARKIYGHPCYEAVADLVSAIFNLRETLDAESVRKRVEAVQAEKIS